MPSLKFLEILFPDQSTTLLGLPIGTPFEPARVPAWLSSVSPDGAGGSFAPSADQAPPSIESIWAQVGAEEGRIVVTRAELTCASKKEALEVMKLVTKALEVRLGQPTPLAPVIKKLGKPLIWTREDGSSLRLDVSPVEQHQVRLAQERTLDA